MVQITYFVGVIGIDSLTYKSTKQSSCKIGKESGTEVGSFEQFRAV